MSNKKKNLGKKKTNEESDEMELYKRKRKSRKYDKENV